MSDLLVCSKKDQEASFGPNAAQQDRNKLRRCCADNSASLARPTDCAAVRLYSSIVDTNGSDLGGGDAGGPDIDGEDTGRNPGSTGKSSVEQVSNTGEDGSESVFIAVDFATGRYEGSSRRAAPTPVPGSGRNAARPPVHTADAEMLYDLFIELTPRQRKFVEVAAWTLADDVYDAIDELAKIPDFASQDISVLSDFPPSTWTQSVTWWRHQARCFNDLATETSGAADPDPRCTGEEMALHLIMQRARGMATDPSDPRTDLTDGLPEHNSDSDWDGPLEFLFQDHDVLMLFDEDIEPGLGAVNLDPAQWFTPFADSSPRDPERGFRR